MLEGLDTLLTISLSMTGLCSLRRETNCEVILIPHSHVEELRLFHTGVKFHASCKITRGEVHVNRSHGAVFSRLTTKISVLHYYAHRVLRSVLVNKWHTKSKVKKTPFIFVIKKTERKRRKRWREH